MLPDKRRGAMSSHGRLKSVNTRARAARTPPARRDRAGSGSRSRRYRYRRICGDRNSSR